MKYSFVIPTYNNKENLINSLEALAYLDYPLEAFEVIVVDDGSSDGLIPAIADFQRRISMKTVRLQRDANSCRSRARNRGWKIASGAVVVFVDSDIIIQPDYLKQLDRYFTSADDCMVIGTRINALAKVHPRNIADGSLFEAIKFSPEGYEALDYRYMTFSAQSFNGRAIPDAWLHAYSCNLAAPRRWLAASGGFDEHIVDWGLEDVELAYRLSALGLHLNINPHLVVVHQNPGHRDDVAIGKARIEGYLGNIRYFLDRHPGALAHYADPVELLVGGHRYREAVPGSTDLCIDNFDEDCSADVVHELLGMAVGRHARIMLFDHARASNLDVHVQKYHSPSCPILYFPMHNKVDVERMMAYVESVRATTTTPA